MARHPALHARLQGLQDQRESGMAELLAELAEQAAWVVIAATHTDPRADVVGPGRVVRDAYVIDTCVKRKLPVVMVLGGGYSKEAWSVQHASIAGLLRTYGAIRRQPPQPKKPDFKIPDLKKLPSKFKK